MINDQSSKHQWSLINDHTHQQLQVTMIISDHHHSLHSLHSTNPSTLFLVTNHLHFGTPFVLFPTHRCQAWRRIYMHTTLPWRVSQVLVWLPKRDLWRLNSWIVDGLETCWARENTNLTATHNRNSVGNFSPKLVGWSDSALGTSRTSRRFFFWGLDPSQFSEFTKSLRRFFWDPKLRKKQKTTKSQVYLSFKKTILL